MRSSLLLRGLLLLALAGCHGEGAAPEALDTPFTATALGLTSVRVRWSVVEQAGYYRLYRRENLTGPFSVLQDNVNRSQSEYLDEDVKPDTKYGYKLEIIDRQGGSLGFTTVSGTATPPLPGITVQTKTQGPPAAIDSNGYTIQVAGTTDTSDVALESNGTRTIAPLKPGSYVLALQGLSANCTVSDSLVRHVTVTDQGLNTVQAVSYLVSCADPSLGNLAVAITTTGDLTPATYGLKLVGITDSLQAYISEQTIPANGSQLFSALKPGSYQLILENVPTNCTVAGGATLDDVPVTAGAMTNRAFSVTCTDPDQAGKPFILGSTFTPSGAMPGTVVELTVTLDLRAEPDQRATTAQATIKFDPAILQYDSAFAGQLSTVFVVGTATPGQVTPGAIKAGLGVPGLVTIAHLFFTVQPGAQSGQNFTTATTGIDVTTNTQAAPQPSVNVSAKVHKTEATFTVGAGGGGGSNQLPTAVPGGPYSGTTGTPVSFNGASSTDPDGSISTYEWTFGDGGTATGATPTHSYTSAVGSPFTVSLKVTDNQGGTSTATTTATITQGSGGGNQSPTARPGGPYSGSVGAQVFLDGSASTDPDGSITSYAWSLGDGATGTGAATSHVYTTAGAYVASLTVTDNAGAQNTSTAMVTISGGEQGGQPFTWASAFSPVASGQVTLTITLDLSADLAQTTGPEALAAWAVVNLKWDPTVLRFFALNIDSGSPGGFNFTNAAQGEISFSGSVNAQNSQGVVPIARVKFDVIGAPGSSTTTQTTLGALIGTPATGNFSYGSFTQVSEGTFTAP